MPMEMLNHFTDDIFLKIQKMSFVELEILIEQCERASRTNCSWHTYYLAGPIKNIAIHFAHLIRTEREQVRKEKKI